MKTDSSGHAWAGPSEEDIIIITDTEVPEKEFPDDPEYWSGRNIF